MIVVRVIVSVCVCVRVQGKDDYGGWLTRLNECIGVCEGQPMAEYEF